MRNYNNFLLLCCSHLLCFLHNFFLQLIIIIIIILLFHRSQTQQQSCSLSLYLFFGDVGTGVMLQVEFLKNIHLSLMIIMMMHYTITHYTLTHDTTIQFSATWIIFQRKSPSKVISANSSRKVATQREVKDLTWLTWLLLAGLVVV